MVTFGLARFFSSRVSLCVKCLLTLTFLVTARGIFKNVGAALLRRCCRAGRLEGGVNPVPLNELWYLGDASQGDRRNRYGQFRSFLL